MAKLSELVAVAARALNVDRRSVALCARYLREAGLIAQKGRGPSAARMGPRDAANLLLGIMASLTLKDAPTAVRLAREATFDGSEINYDGQIHEELPPFKFLSEDGRPLPLGGAVQSLIDEAARCGVTFSGQSRPNTFFALGISRPGLFGFMELCNENDRYVAKYRRHDPRLDRLSGMFRAEKARELELEEGSGMRSRTEISIYPILEIACALRGQKSEEGERVNPPSHVKNV